MIYLPKENHIEFLCKLYDEELRGIDYEFIFSLMRLIQRKGTNGSISVTLPSLQKEIGYSRSYISKRLRDLEKYIDYETTPFIPSKLTLMIGEKK